MTSVSKLTVCLAACIALGCGDSGGDEGGGSGGTSSGTGGTMAGTTASGTGGTMAGTSGTSGATADPQCVADAMARGDSQTCAECACANCADEVAAVYEPIDPTSGPLSQAVIACGRENCCRGTESYCGKPIDLLACSMAAKGPCVAPIETAAGAMGLLAIAGPAADPTTPLGAATALGYCLTGNPMSSSGMVVMGKCETECMPASCSTMTCAPVP